MEKTRKQLTVNLGEQHDAWIALAQKLGRRPATLAAEVLKYVLEDNDAQAEVTTVNEARRGIYIRLHEDELECLDVMAAELGKTRQKTIIAIIRDAIAAEPQFSTAEEATLKESNYQLARIGVNLNQIAHRVNGMGNVDLKNARGRDLLKRLNERTDALTTAINKHVDIVWKLINAGRYRISLRGDD